MLTTILLLTILLKMCNFIEYISAETWQILSFPDQFLINIWERCFVRLQLFQARPDGWAGSKIPRVCIWREQAPSVPMNDGGSLAMDDGQRSPSVWILCKFKNFSFIKDLYPQGHAQLGGLASITTKLNS